MPVFVGEISDFCGPLDENLIDCCILVQLTDLETKKGVLLVRNLCTIFMLSTVTMCSQPEGRFVWTQKLHKKIISLKPWCLVLGLDVKTG